MDTMNHTYSWPASVILLHANMQGKASDGHSANLITLQNKAGMTATFMDLGATWLSCTLPLTNKWPLANENREILLGIDSLEAFYQQPCYLGATIGRFANRIKNGQFTVEGSDYQLNNNHAQYCLHGGVEGFDRKRWQMVEFSEQHVVYSLCSEDGEQGFPGQLDVTVTYCLTENNRIEITYNAVTDKACPVNLTNHAYFNLQGHREHMDCRDHQLVIQAEQYLPTDENGLPTMGLIPVKNSSFDFTQPKTIGIDFLQDDHQKVVSGYDHSYLISGRRNEQQPVVKVTSPDAQVVMEVMTTKPAIQFYTGNFLQGCPKRGGGSYSNYAGFALETQYLPDSPNHPEWAMSQSLLQVGEEYRHKTVYQFGF